MISGINSFNTVNNVLKVPGANTVAVPFSATSNPIKHQGQAQAAYSHLVSFSAQLSASDEKMYTELTKMLATANPSDLHITEGDISPTKKLDTLLKNGKLLDRSSSDKSSTLENLYKMATTPRLNNINNTKFLAEAVCILHNPASITQKFGDIPLKEKYAMLTNPNTAQEARAKMKEMDVEYSGTCVAASIEFSLANKRPAEFARFAQGLSSEKGSVEHTVQMKSLSSNPLDAIWLINAFEMEPREFSFDKVKFELKPDKNAHKRVMIQNENWDPGERKMLDVLMQATFMQIGSQQAYCSLTDTHTSKFNSNPQGLTEFEKTFVESVVRDREKFSIVYQVVDEDQTLLGHKKPASIIEKNIKTAIDKGDDVIVGYVTVDSANKIEGGHEITIMDYKTDQNGKTTFICNDTDNDKSELVEYSADYILPKIHHAGYSSDLVKNCPDLWALLNDSDCSNHIPLAA
ncbi:hypothetical protein tpqmel_0466 [Candidatus Gastranaerophilus sp. (ex Termes propinquus)]|nr:hypothetical protein tpqmel_0466 [Candidatus Gastranaerophilus sp. (ex Termes propinquus)]